MNKFAIDPKSPIPVWAQTKSRLLYLILGGKYKEGDKLPTVRDLAVELGINYNTANKAYQDLERDGYVRTVRGKGCFVTGKASEGFSVVESNLDFLMQEITDEAITKGMTGEELLLKFASRLCSDGKITKSSLKKVQQAVCGDEVPESLKEVV